MVLREGYEETDTAIKACLDGLFYILYMYLFSTRPNNWIVCTYITVSSMLFFTPFSVIDLFKIIGLYSDTEQNMRVWYTMNKGKE